MTTESTNQNIWCHICGIETSGHSNADRELECLFCHSTFVESLGQGVENFIGQNRIESANNSPAITTSPTRLDTSLNADTGNPISSSSATITSSVNDTINHILGGILGMGVQMGPTQQTSLLDVVQQAAAESGRPVEVWSCLLFKHRHIIIMP